MGRIAHHPEALEQFGPKLIAFWKKAVESKVELLVPDKQTAVALRHRLYRCRKALIAQQHEVATLAVRVIIRLLPAENNQWKLIAILADNQFEDLLSDFDIGETPAPEL